MPTKQITLNKTHLLHNYEHLTSLDKDVKIAPVLKSNAYGHGLLEIAKILDKVHAPFFCVNSFDEAYTLWTGIIKTPILIMGYVDPQDLKKEKYPFSYTTYNYDQLSAINKFQPGANVHIFIDTGMHREGFRLKKLSSLLENLNNFPNINFIGLMSHLASGDKPTSHQTQNQLQEFKEAINIVDNYGLQLQFQHITASAGFLNFADKKITGNISRVGKALYGIDPRGPNPNLHPLLTLTSKIVQVKKLPKNTLIGYNGAYKTTKPTIVGVLPIGYYDGIDRRLSNKGFTTVNNTLCPIIGRISMNITTIDITKVKNPKVDLQATIISSNSDNPNSIENIAKICGTIPYDIAVKINPFIKRVIVSSET